MNCDILLVVAFIVWAVALYSIVYKEGYKDGYTDGASDGLRKGKSDRNA